MKKILWFIFIILCAVFLGAQDEESGVRWKFRDGVTFGQSAFAVHESILRASFPKENTLTGSFYIAPYTGTSGSEAYYKELSLDYTKGFKSGFSLGLAVSFAPPVEGYQTIAGGLGLSYGSGDKFFTETGLDCIYTGHSQEMTGTGGSSAGTKGTGSSSGTSSSAKTFSQITLAPRVSQTFFGVSTLSAGLSLNKYLINEDKGNFSLSGRQKNVLASTSGFVNTSLDLGWDQTLADFLSVYLGYSRITYLTESAIDDSLLFELTFCPAGWLELSPGVNYASGSAGGSAVYYSFRAGFSW